MSTTTKEKGSVKKDEGTVAPAVVAGGNGSHNPDKPGEAAAVVVSAPVLQKKPTLEELRSKAQRYRAEEEEIVAGLLSRKQIALSEIEEIDGLLAEMGKPQEKTVPTATAAPAKPGARPGITPVSGGKGAVKGARGDNEWTAQTGVEELCLRAGAKGLTRPDITAKMITDLNYKSKNLPDEGMPTAEQMEAFSDSIYTGGINKAVKDGTIIAVGKRGSTHYVHKDHHKEKAA